MAPVDWSQYPQDWNLTRALVRARSGGQCECTGQCGLHQPNPAPRRCIERHSAWATFAKGRVRLACAHTCTCRPLCSNTTHLLDLCQRCHIRIDRFRHARARIATQQRARAAQIDAQHHHKG